MVVGIGVDRLHKEKEVVAAEFRARAPVVLPAARCSWSLVSELESGVLSVSSGLSASAADLAR